MKKFLLAMLMLSGMMANADTQQEPQDIKPQRVGGVGSGDYEILALSYEPKAGGNIILEKCDDKHYDCAKIERILKKFNKISTPTEEDTARKAHLATKFILFHNDYKLERKNR